MKKLYEECFISSSGFLRALKDDMVVLKEGERRKMLNVLFPGFEIKEVSKKRAVLKNSLHGEIELMYRCD